MITSIRLGGRNICAGSVFTAALLAGCASSAPLRFYTLSELPAQGRAPASSVDAGASARPSVAQVVRVRIPTELDRSEIVQRIDANRLHIGEQDRWAAPLSDMIRRTLSAHLQAHPAPLAPAAVSVDIHQFTVDTSCAVSLQASWQIRPAAGFERSEAAGSGHSGAAGSEHAGSAGSEHSGKGAVRLPPSTAACPVAALPARMSEALTRLAEQIAGTLPPRAD